MTFVVKIYENRNMQGPFYYLVEYDPNGYDGMGWLETSSRLEEAKEFENVVDAFMLFRMVSRTHPVRQDGKPNRPLTAYTTEILPKKEAQE